MFLQASDTPYFINKICFESSKVFNVPIFLCGVGIDLGIFSLVSDFDKTSLDKNFYLNKDRYIRLFDKEEIKKYLSIFQVQLIDKRETIRFSHKKNYYVFIAKKPKKEEL